MSLIALLAVVLGCAAAAGALELYDLRRSRKKLEALLRRERAEREKDGRA